MSSRRRARGRAKKPVSRAKARTGGVRKGTSHGRRSLRAPASPALPKGRGLLIVLSGPSGAGKSTLARRLASADSRIWRSVSMTTRSPREGERDGIDYVFVAREEFARAVSKGELLEHAEVHGELYGTPRAPVVDRLLQGRDVLLVIDVQGGMQVKRAAPEAVLVFVLPPSRGALEARLRERGSEDERVIASRLRTADTEVRLAQRYDYLVINDDIERAVADLLAVASAERLRTSRRPEIPW